MEQIILIVKISLSLGNYFWLGWLNYMGLWFNVELRKSRGTICWGTCTQLNQRELEHQTVFDAHITLSHTLIPTHTI